MLIVVVILALVALVVVAKIAFAILGAVFGLLSMAVPLLVLVGLGVAVFAAGRTTARVQASPMVRLSRRIFR
jgi:energy-coupling factor transporter transmembrane protein EcfT